MKLGELQPHKPYRFLQEEILEGVFPLSRFKSPINIFLLIVIYVVWGFLLFFIYHIPNKFIIAGSISAIGICIWTLGIVMYANSLRDLDLDEANSSIVYKKTLLEFMDNLFHNSSLFYGVAISMVVYVIILNSNIIGDDPVLKPILGNFTLLVSITDRTSLIDQVRSAMHVNSVPFPILLYIFFISFDICYRVGLSFHILLTQARRNWSFYRILRQEKFRKQFNKQDLDKIEGTDKYHYIALAGGIFLFPLTFIDILFFLSLIGVVVFVFVTATFNIVTLRFLIKKYLREDQV